MTERKSVTIDASDHCAINGCVHKEHGFPTWPAGSNPFPPYPDLSSLRKGAEEPCPHAPTYDAGLCCGHPDDCTFVSPLNISKEENDA